MEDSYLFYHKLNDYRIKNAFIPVPNANHCFNYVISPRTFAVSDIVIQYLNTLYNNYSSD